MDAGGTLSAADRMANRSAAESDDNDAEAPSSPRARGRTIRRRESRKRQRQRAADAAAAAEAAKVAGLESNTMEVDAVAPASDSATSPGSVQRDDGVQPAAVGTPQAGGSKPTAQAAAVPQHHKH
jgi:hypothetical protein